ncbi:DUF1835 domain-containing protein [Chitinilyticum piscinae]|uniref:DUF1835 domain-containing protein n=1 Tax=Chitinilyticum piscinae TaxID=2866724 RepID=A0A8J7FIN5_9NEIS|nr:DUF3658 domain-containing protein [Chitinilyticum piscinae]MBE9608880.1 DUF1835 domain-containing protein [Chitinilyticum piscinae]
MNKGPHLILGDCAAGCLRAALPDATVLVARDDLPVGPLADVDSDGVQRAAFWSEVNPFFPYRFADKLAEERALLASLPDALTVWIGNSSGEELMLRRVAWWRQGKPFTLIRVPQIESVFPEGMFALGMCEPAQLQAAAGLGEVLSAQALGVLAAEWETLRQSDGLRSWVNGTFHCASIDSLDDELWLCTGSRWEPAFQAVGEWMGNSQGFFRSDWLGSWRMALLGRAGRVEFAEADPDFSLARSRVRRTPHHRA